MNKKEIPDREKVIKTLKRFIKPKFIEDRLVEDICYHPDVVLRTIEMRVLDNIGNEEYKTFTRDWWYVIVMFMFNPDFDYKAYQEKYPDPRRYIKYKKGDKTTQDSN